jgi:hypothetical protein
MIQRDRAWRRRKARIVLRREDETKEIAFRPRDETEVKHGAHDPKRDKPHRPGALTHAQDLRLQSALAQAEADGLRDGELPVPATPDE